MSRLLRRNRRKKQPERINFVSDWKERCCPICGENDNILTLGWRKYSLLSKRDGQSYGFKMKDAMCQHCNFVFVREVPTQGFIDDYYLNAKIRASGNFDYLNRATVIEKLLIKGESILEIGPGSKALSTFLTGFDIDVLHVKGSWPERKYDLVAAYYVLEHIIHPRRFLGMLHSLIRENGYIILEVPDFDEHPNEAFYVEHFNCFTKWHLSILLMSAGFRVIETIDSHSRHFGFAIIAQAKPLATDEIQLKYSQLREQVDGREYDIGKSQEFQEAGAGI